MSHSQALKRGKVSLNILGRAEGVIWKKGLAEALELVSPLGRCSPVPSSTLGDLTPCGLGNTPSSRGSRLRCFIGGRGENSNNNLDRTKTFTGKTERKKVM